MSYPRNMAGAVALLASSSLLGLGCMVGADDPGKTTDEQSIVEGDVGTLETGAQGGESAGDVASDDETEATGESKDAIFYGRGFGRFGSPFHGRGFGRFGYPFYGYGGYGGFGGFGGFGGYGGYGGYGYPFYGYGGYGYPFYGCPYGLC